MLQVGGKLRNPQELTKVSDWVTECNQQPCNLKYDEHMWRRLIYHPEVNYALRQTLVLCLPVAVGLLFGNLQSGLLFSLVPACCNIAGLDTPHRRFFKRLIVGGSLFAISSLIMQLLLLYTSVPLPVILVVMALLLGRNR